MTDFSGLAQLLVVLSDPESTPEQRRYAERSLRGHLNRWLPRWLARRFAQFSDDSAVLDEILDHICDRASGGTQRFRAAHGDRSAFDWVTQVANNRAIDIRRRKQREAKAVSAQRDALERQRLDEQEEQERAQLTKRIYGLLCEVVKRTYHPSEHNVWAPRIEMAFEIVWTTDGRSLLEQHEYVRPGESDPAVLDAAHDLAAQHRRRARKRVSHMLASLVAAGQVDPEEAARFAAANRIPWPPPLRGTRKSAASEGQDD
jgi:hypothetical protein